jgi:hypothetical protein
MFVGAVMTIVGFMGCCGALKESICMIVFVSIFAITAIHKVFD